jgi:hypothetical protein
MSLSEAVIVCAAIKHDNGLILPSPRHFDRTCHALIDELGVKTEYSDWEQGFIDQHGRFYTRKEAYLIAVKQNQIKRPSTYATNELYSENLY